jgi:hypothetical protein
LSHKRKDWLSGHSHKGKGSAPVGVTSAVHDRMPVIVDPDGYDQCLASSEQQVANRDELQTSSPLLHKPQSLAPSAPGNCSGTHVSNAAKVVSG